jgi:hypothetical protein
MSKTYITIANADSQYSPATRSNDMLLFAGSADQRVIIGVGANVDQALTASMPNYLSIGSNDTIIGNNLIVNGTITDSTGAAYGIGTGTGTSYNGGAITTNNANINAGTATISCGTLTSVSSQIYITKPIAAVGQALTSGAITTNGSNVNVGTGAVSCGKLVFSTSSQQPQQPGNGSGSGSGMQPRFFTKYVQVATQTIPSNAWTVITNFASVFSIGSLYNITYSPDGYYTNVSGKTLTISVSYTLVGMATVGNTSGTRSAYLRVYNETGALLQQHARDTRSVITTSSTSLIGTLTTNTIILDQVNKLQFNPDTATMISTNTVLVGTAQPNSLTDTTLSGSTIQLQATKDLDPTNVTSSDPTTLSGSTFVQLFPNHKFALFANATASYLTDESTSTVCIAELG